MQKVSSQTQPKHISQHVEAFLKSSDKPCNPNSILKDIDASHRNSRRFLGDQIAQATREKEIASWNRRALAAVPPPQMPEQRPSGLKTFQAQSMRSEKSVEVPVNPQGIPLRSKRRVYDAAGNQYTTLQSQAYDQSALCGSIKTFPGQQCKTFSHSTLLFPNNSSVQQEAATGFSHIENCHEWEKKVLSSLHQSTRLGSPQLDFGATAPRMTLVEQPKGFYSPLGSAKAGGF